MDVMGIASVAMYAANASNLSDIGTAVLDMAIDQDNAQGSAMAAMLENSVNPAVGGNIDVRL